MRRWLVWLMVAAPGLAFGDSTSPPQWSPDGRWLAYGQTSVPGRPTPPTPPGWLFEVGETPDRARPDGRPATYRIIGTAVGTGVSVCLAESSRPMTAPGWSPDGRRLAFGRLAGVFGVASGRFEVVIRDGSGSERVVLSRTLAATARVDEETFAARGVAWSGDGRSLAVPDPTDPDRASVVRVDTGQTLKSFCGARWFAWSPDGSRLAVVGGADFSKALGLVDGGFGPVRRLTDLGRVGHTPFWSRDGRWVFAVARRPGGPGVEVELLRVQPETGAAETFARLGAAEGGRPGGDLPVAVALDRDGAELFAALPDSNLPPAVVWFRPRTSETVDRFHPLDPSLGVGSLALAPSGRSLAMRVEGPSGGTSVAVWDVADRTLTPLAPDDDARTAWVDSLVTSACRVLEQTLRPVVVRGRLVSRPSRLPAPGEVPADQEVGARLRRIGRFGRPLCDRPAVATVGDPILDAYLAEARLLFDTLREDWPAALRSLDALATVAEEPDRRLRLLSVRAQLLIGLGEPDRARDTIGYLREIEARVPSRFEVTTAGWSITPEPGPTLGWADFLARRLDDPREVPPASGRTSDGQDEPWPPPHPPMPARRPQPFGGGVRAAPVPRGRPAGPAAPLVRRGRAVAPAPQPPPPPAPAHRLPTRGLPGGGSK